MAAESVRASADVLPEQAEAVANPANTAVLVTALVKASLSQEWRQEHAHTALLDALADLIELHLARLGDELPDLGCGDDLSERSNEAACVACLKLARNLCAGAPQVQEHWWHRGLIQKLAVRLREDLAALGGSRSTGWREAVPSFVTNTIAGNVKLREAVLAELFPHHLAAFCALCWKRPELAFMLAQNLFACHGGSGAVPTQQLVETEDGHCLLFLLLSFLRGRQDERENNLNAKALEWATVFFHGLWLSGGFVPACRGIKELSVRRLHEFLGGVAGLRDGWSTDETGQAGGTLPVSVGFWRLSESLCGHAEARCLMWHTIHGLLAGPGDVGHSSGAASVELAQALLGDAAFVELAAGDMARCLASLASAWGLDWRPLPCPPEAAAVLGVDTASLDLLGFVDSVAELPALATGTGLDEVARGSTLAESGEGAQASSLAAGSTVEASFGSGLGDSVEASSPPSAGQAVDGGGCGRAALTSTLVAEHTEPQRSEQTCLAAQCLFQEVLAAVVDIAAVPGVAFPPRLAGLCLSGCVAFIDALHRLRFGDQVQRRTYSASAAEAARACLLVEQLRLCANVLYENGPAQDFIRLAGGLRVLLSHCHADHELPLLREAGIFAVRNATHLNITNQAAVRELLAEQHAAASAGQEVIEDLDMS